jgi:hypothetical protein
MKCRSVFSAIVGAVCLLNLAACGQYVRREVAVSNPETVGRQVSKPTDYFPADYVSQSKCWPLWKAVSDAVYPFPKKAKPSINKSAGDTGSSAGPRFKLTRMVWIVSAKEADNKPPSLRCAFFDSNIATRKTEIFSDMDLSGTWLRLSPSFAPLFLSKTEGFVNVFATVDKDELNVSLSINRRLRSDFNLASVGSPGATSNHATFFYAPTSRSYVMESIAIGTEYISSDSRLLAFYVQE